MINALYEPFPESVTADGTEYPIITDFREWIRFTDMLRDDGIEMHEKILLLANWITQPPETISQELVEAVFAFYRADELNYVPETSGQQDSVKRPPAFDWKIDAQYIIGDFLCYYGIDLINTDYMHWWKFRALFAALPDESVMKKRIAYRCMDTTKIKDCAEKQRIMQIQAQLALPFELSDEDIGGIFSA